MDLSMLMALSLMALSSSAMPTQTSEEWHLNRTALMIRDSGSCSGTFGDGPTRTYGDFTGCTSQYGDGSGTYIRSDDVFHYGKWQIGGDKCWTDLFHVSEEAVSYDWYALSSSCVNCANSPTCSVVRTNTQQLCTTDSWTAEGGLDLTILKDIFSVSASVSHTWSTQKCNSQAVQVNCGWTDSAYHAVALQNHYTRIHGYIRRRCDFKGDDKGDVTVWSKDWVVDVPTGDIHTRCDAWCDNGDNYYVPSPDSPPPSAPAPSPAAPAPSPSTPGTPSTGSSTCSWEGHCMGASCSSYNDCSDNLVCNNGVCGSP